MIKPDGLIVKLRIKSILKRLDGCGKRKESAKIRITCPRVYEKLVNR